MFSYQTNIEQSLSKKSILKINHTDKRQILDSCYKYFCEQHGFNRLDIFLNSSYKHMWNFPFFDLVLLVFFLFGKFVKCPHPVHRFSIAKINSNKLGLFILGTNERQAEKTFFKLRSFRKDHRVYSFIVTNS